MQVLVYITCWAFPGKETCWISRWFVDDQFRKRYQKPKFQSKKTSTNSTITTLPVDDSWVKNQCSDWKRWATRRSETNAGSFWRNRSNMSCRNRLPRWASRIWKLSDLLLLCQSLTLWRLWFYCESARDVRRSLALPIRGERFLFRCCA